MVAGLVLWTLQLVGLVGGFQTINLVPEQEGGVGGISTINLEVGSVLLN